ncbi:MAG: capsular biosynthesis protein [Bacteroidetes bacterium]|nr:MAG: capsular biosynthesis protein [Bacteroidota bacterium]
MLLMVILLINTKGCLLIRRFRGLNNMSRPNLNQIIKEEHSHIDSVLHNSGRLRNFIDNKTGYFIYKRTLDIVISFALTVLVLSWLIPIISLAIFISSGAPIFFRQKRIGLVGKSFYCYKFRTMVINEDSDKIQARENDARITAIGKFLRKTNLDELPQILNVLNGSMSLVGPRPHMYSDCNHFASVIPGYKFRNLVKPGITGMAQIKGYHGPTSDFESIFRRYQWDAFYIRNLSIWTDLRIIRQTVIQSLKSLLRLCVS